MGKMYRIFHRPADAQQPCDHTLITGATRTNWCRMSPFNSVMLITAHPSLFRQPMPQPRPYPLLALLLSGSAVHRRQARCHPHQCLHFWQWRLGLPMPALPARSLNTARSALMSCICSQQLDTQLLGMTGPSTATPLLHVHLHGKATSQISPQHHAATRRQHLEHALVEEGRAHPQSSWRRRGRPTAPGAGHP
jgi:hypothetical protein